MAIRPGHGAGAHAGRESSRSPVHAHHVVHGDAGVDGEESTWKKGPRLFPRSPSWNPSGAGATEGFCSGRHRKSAANDRGEQPIPSPRGWKSPQGVERHLVHRIHTKL